METMTMTSFDATKKTSIFGRLVAWVKKANDFTKREQTSLVAHRDMWLGKRSPKLEKVVSHYSY
ncbi:hypothetical protein ACXYMP_05895 [Aliiroseovarius sp. CAU 1755]